MDKATRAVFENYFNVQAIKAGALTFGQKIELAGLLQQEARDKGKVPVAPDQVVSLPVAHAAVQAVLRGQQVAVTGKEVSVGQPRPRGLAGLSTPVKLAILLVPLVLAAVVVIALSASRSPAGDTGNKQAIPTKAIAWGDPLVVIPSPRAGTNTAATPYNFQPAAGGGGLTAWLGEPSNTPASVEFAGYSFGLSVSSMNNGVWDVKGPEWLAGTELRRVVAIPYTDELNAAVTRLNKGAELRVRLRSGEVVMYRMTDVQRVKRSEIELLTDKTPSLVVFLSGERAAERTALIATAVHSALDTSAAPVAASGPATTTAPVVIAAAAVTGVGPARAASPGYNADDGVGYNDFSFTQIMTTALAVVNPRTGVRLAVTDCLRSTQIGAQKPGNGQQFLICGVQLSLAVGQSARYSGQSLSLSEVDWLQPVSSWWPTLVTLSNGLGDGLLTPENPVLGKVAGLVKKAGGLLDGGGESKPALVWEQSGLRYIIQLEGK